MQLGGRDVCVCVCTAEKIYRITVHGMISLFVFFFGIFSPGNFRTIL